MQSHKKLIKPLYQRSGTDLEDCLKCFNSFLFVWFPRNLVFNNLKYCHFREQTQLKFDILVTNKFIYTKFQHSKCFTTKSFSSFGHAVNVSQLCILPLLKSLSTYIPNFPLEEPITKQDCWP